MGSRPFATLGLGGRFVPIYEVELPHIWEYIVKDSDIKVLFVSKQEKNGMLTPTLKLKRYCVR